MARFNMLGLVLIVAISGCSKTGQHGIITVSVIDDRQSIPTPLIGSTVVFVDSEKTQIVMTDANGQANADVEDRASVTSVRPFVSNQVFVDTVLDAQPGDTLHFGIANPNTDAAGSAYVAFSPIDEVVDLTTTCGYTSGSASPILLSLTTGCLSSPVEIIAETNTGSALEYSDLQNAPVAPGGSVTMPPFAAEPTFTATFSDIPSGLANTQFFRLSGPFTSAVNLAPGSSGGTLSMTCPIGSNAWMGGKFVITAPQDDQPYLQEVYDLVDVGAFNYSFDVAASLLPWLGDPTVDLATGVIEIPVMSTGASNESPDIVVVSLAGTTSTGSVLWNVIGSDVTGLYLPNLPAQLGLTPMTLASAPSAAAIEVGSGVGYDQARQNAAAMFDPEPAGATRVHLSDSPLASYSGPFLGR